LDSNTYPDVLANQWNNVGKAKVYYLSPDESGLTNIAALINATNHDILYLNSFFDFRFSILPLVVRRFWGLNSQATILAPRGEFAKGAIKLKFAKKCLYLALAKWSGLLRHLIWQASNTYETEDIRRVLGSRANRIYEAIELPPRIVTLSDALKPRELDSGRLKVLYLSRIGRDKNLLFALEVLSKVTANVEFNIVGPIREPHYWDRCQKAIGTLPENIHVSYLGAIEHSKVLTVFVEHDLFFMPTVGENYGYVIPESMSVGTPVLISNRAGWRNLVGTGAGWDLPLEQPQKFVEVIESCAAMSHDQRFELRMLTRAYLAEAKQSFNAVDASRNLFMRALGKSKGTQ
jgi:glycosyltransferase involved in cell wall biosynthesis